MSKFEVKDLKLLKMYKQNNDEEKKLDWMYKGPNSNVSREEYLLGRKVDKTLDQLNEEEKLKQGLVNLPKNKVEHECIPPSIRDFNKVVQSEQVDLSTKLQEDPLVAIKKREEETRRQFLQNPVQLKKLQKALKAQQAKKKKKKKKASDSDSDLERKLTEKLLGKKSERVSKEEKNLDIILIHKYEALKDKITESDLQEIMDGNFTDSDDSNSEDEKVKKKKKKKTRESSEEPKEKLKGKHKKDDKKQFRYSNYKSHSSGHKYQEKRSTSSSESDSDDNTNYSRRKYDSDDSDNYKPRKINYGLVKSDGTKIKFTNDHRRDYPVKSKPVETPKAPVFQKHKTKHLTEEEKDKLRREMMQNAVERDKERARNVKRYRQEDEREKTELNYDPAEFVNKQLLKSANISSVESRIKSNVGKIQRSSRDMDKNFSKR